MKRAKDFSIIAIIFIIIIIISVNKENAVETIVLEQETDLLEDEAQGAFSEDQAEESEGAFKEEIEIEPLLSVYITGGVLNPGVYELEQRARTADLLEAAGGALETARLDQINLAAFLEDGKHIKIPTIDDPLEDDLEEDPLTEALADDESTASEAGGEGVKVPQGPVNINTASLSQLTTLPGIGNVIGQNIIDYRNANGPFKSKEEIKKVSRIGDAVYGQIENLITTE